LCKITLQIQKYGRHTQNLPCNVDHTSCKYKVFLYRIQNSLFCSPPFFLLSLCKIAFFVASTIHTLFKKKLYKLVLMLSAEEKTNLRFCKQITYMFSLRPIHWCSPNLILPLMQMSLKKENQQKNTVWRSKTECIV